jgi:hypothetical protein
VARIEDADVVEHLVESGLADWKIERALTDQDNEVTRAKAIEAATRAGLPIVDIDEARLMSRTGEIFKSVAEAKKYTFGEDERLQVDLDYKGKASYVVLEPRATKGLDSSDEAVRERAKATLGRKVERETNARYVAQLVPILAKPKKTILMPWLVKSYVEAQTYTFAKEVCELLNLEVIVRQERTGSGDDAKVSNMKDHNKTVHVWAAQGETELLQVAFALVIAQAQAGYGHNSLIDEVTQFLDDQGVTSKLEIKAEVTTEFTTQAEEAAAKKAERDARRAAKEAEAAAAAETEPEPDEG